MILASIGGGLIFQRKIRQDITKNKNVYVISCLLALVFNYEYPEACSSFRNYDYPGACSSFRNCFPELPI